MLILVVYTLKDINITIYPYGLKEAIAILLVAFLHVKYRNALISIILGTGCYIILG